MSEAPEIISPVVPSPLDAYRGRGVSICETPPAQNPTDNAFLFSPPEAEVSVGDLFIVALDKVFASPKKATDAFYIYLHIIEKEIEPLLEKVKEWSLKALNDEERVACEKLIEDGKLNEAPMKVGN
jgi:hypothetical protein